MIDYYQYLLGISYWAWSGTLYLIFLTYKDFKDKRVINDRHNYVMLGLSIALLSHIHRPLWYMLSIMVILLSLHYYLRKFNLIGGADITAISWIFLGNSILGATYAAWWFIFFSIGTSFYTFVKGRLKIKENTPFFPVLLSTFFINCLVMGLY